MQKQSLSNLLPPHYRRLVEDWLHDDVPTLDIGGYVVGSDPVEAYLLFKGVPEDASGAAVQGAVLAGAPFFSAVFESLGCAVSWEVEEGSVLQPPCRAATVRGPARAVLLGERTALNILTRASGVATAARAMQLLCQRHGWGGEVAGSRKLTPGAFRLVEKYALLVGGVSTHRMDLSQMTMLKDNHIWAAGSITAAVKAATSVAGFSTKVEVEARSLEEALEAAAAGAAIVMLDNYPSPAALHADAAAVKAQHPGVLIEASGGIRLDTLASYFSPHVDILSSGSLTQGYATADFSLKVNKGKGVGSIAGNLAAGAASSEAAGKQ